MPPFRIYWLDEAKADVRALDQSTAMRIFEGILRFARTGAGDIVALQGELAGMLRLRIGDYRVQFTIQEDAMHLQRSPSKQGVSLRGLRCRCTKITAFNGDEIPRIVAITGTSPFDAEAGTCTLI